MKKINIAQVAKNQGKQSPALDLIQVVKDAYSDIQECLLLQVKPIEELPKINSMSKLFNMSVARAAVFAVIYCRSEHEVRLSEKGVVSILRNYFDGESRNIRLEIKELKRLGLIERNREEGVFYFTMHPDIVQALDDNNLEKVSNVGPRGLEESLDYFKKKLMDHDVLLEKTRTTDPIRRCKLIPTPQI